MQNWLNELGWILIVYLFLGCFFALISLVCAIHDVVVRGGPKKYIQEYLKIKKPFLREHPWATFLLITLVCMTTSIVAMPYAFYKAIDYFTGGPLHS